jgi:hypothetical protein
MELETFCRIKTCKCKTESQPEIDKMHSVYLFFNHRMRCVMRWILFAAVVGMGIGGLVLAQVHGDGHGKDAIVKVVSAVDIDEEVSGKKAKATTFEVTFGPGVASPRIVTLGRSLVM